MEVIPTPHRSRRETSELTANPFRKPWCYFALQVVLLAIALFFLNKFSPVSVGDTPDYTGFPLGDPAAALSHPRTFGYPLFLAIAGLFAPSYQAAPLLDFVIHVIAVAVFWLGLRQIIRGPWTSMAVASSLLYSNILLRYGNNLAADSLASSLAIATLGWLLVTLFAERQRIPHWCLLALGVFACYQVRPAYLFMIPLVPVLALALWWLVRPTLPPWHEWCSLLIKLLLVVALPYLAFCSLRWAVVDHFSVVSFGGNNFAAITCMFVNEADVEHLPEDLQPLGKAIVQRRHQVAEQDPGYTAEATRRYMQIESPFDTNITAICVPAAREVYGERWLDGDRALWRFAAAVIREKPTYYGVWLVKAFIRGIYMIVSEYIMNPVYFLLLVALAACHTGSVILRKHRPGTAGEADPDWFVEINALWILAAGFALAKVLLVVITSPALGRFMDAAGVLLACVLVRALANRVIVCRYYLAAHSD